MPKEKRTKPCSNCKKSKVRCIYTSGLPCERCVKIGQAINCQFVPKLPSLKLPSFGQGGIGNPISQHHASVQADLVSAHHSSSPTHEPELLPPLNQASTARRQPFGPPNITSTTGIPTSMPTGPVPNIHTIQNSTFIPNIPNISNGQNVSNIPNMIIPNHHQDVESQWKTSIESRISSFDNKLNDLVDILKTNQQLILEQRYSSYSPQVQGTVRPQPVMPAQQRRLSPTAYYSTPEDASANQSRNSLEGSPQDTSSQNSQQPSFHHFTDSTQANKRHISEVDPASSESPAAINKLINQVPKRQKPDINRTYPDSADFRDSLLTKDEAKELFNFFDANISQQLFGFEISKFSIDNIWDNSPVLVCAISTIASIHHPKLSDKSEELKNHLKGLCSSLIYKGKPKNENEGFNTIVALILCSFWLSDSQMFTGLALQLAKEYGLNNPYTENKDKLKLWYLLYVLDGQQSLTFNRQPLVNSREYSLVHSKEILLSEAKSLESDVKTIKSKDDETVKEDDKQLESQTKLNADMRLVSQVEYNQALNEAFKGNAWDLLVPSSFGIPSKSNLELDKWMVSWTVLLAPSNNGAVWSSKSTLIYYNFAKMHINSSAVRQLQVNPGKMLPKWDATEGDTHFAPSKAPIPDSEDSEDSDSDEEDSANEDEFISNKGLLSEDETIINANIAMSAAQTVLNLVINDTDILDNLKYVPVHIHIMLYYAALLLLNPPSKSNNKSVKFDPYTYNLKVIRNLKIIKTLQKKIYNNLPIDTKFGDRLIRSLHEIVEEKLSSVQHVIEELPEGFEKTELLKQVKSLNETSDSKNIIELLDDNSSRGSTPPGPEKISAWPGSNHGHP